MEGRRAPPAGPIAAGHHGAVPTTDMLQLARTDEHRFVAPHVEGPGVGGNVFGGQLLAQLVVAAHAALDGRTLTSLQSVFARGVRDDAPILIDVEPIAGGRSAGSARLVLHQGGPPCGEAIALALEPQAIEPTHTTQPASGAPGGATPIESALRDVEVRIEEGDLGEGAGRPDPVLWLRAEAAEAGPTEAKAMLAYASEPWFVAAALRRHDGWSQAQAFDRYTPAVVSHSLWFHEHAALAGWWRFGLTTPSFGASRVFGRADVHSTDGHLVASVAQENLVRPRNL